jgi:hypothetical protein
VPLGLLDQQVWVRDIENLGMAKTRRQRKTQEKESQRWLDSLSSTQQLMTPEIQVVTITDAEGDIYDLFSRFASG